ncbi:helix-turn-helix domain-containing protein [Leptospira sp. 96542]|nr:helix-turn-helix domain-containing protein [Leptospira sp. 96542]
MTKASHLPVVSETGELLGLLSKDRVHRELSDLGAERTDYESIPTEILELELSPNLLLFFKESQEIPVIGHLGERVDYWDKPRFLAAFTKLDAKTNRDPNLTSIQTKIEKQKESKDTIHWFMEMILSHFPDGLFATDVSGNSIFYNESFETKILPKPALGDSLKKAEDYLRDLNREVFANYLKEHDLDLTKETNISSLQTPVFALDMFLRIITLRKDKKIVGFLYHFTELGDGVKKHHKTGIRFPSLEDAFLAKFPLEKVLEEMESAYIHESLKKNQNNISHAASELGIPRTTLQNRIKYLNLNERFKEENPAKKVIPRKRSDKKEKVKKELAPKQKLAPKKKAKTKEKVKKNEKIPGKKAQSAKKSKKRR